MSGEAILTLALRASASVILFLVGVALCGVAVIYGME